MSSADVPYPYQLCQPLGYRGDFINEPEYIHETVGDDDRRIYACGRCLGALGLNHLNLREENGPSSTDIDR